MTRIYDPYTDELLPINGVLTEVSMESHMVSMEAVTHDLKNIKQIMQKHGSDVTFNGKLADALKRYIYNFINKNPDHVKALGGNLLGVYPMRFTTSDRLEWEEDLLKIDPKAIRVDVLSLPHMDDVGRRATDTFNISCIWLCHKFYTSSLPIRQKEEAMKNCMVILQYKLFSSILAHYFPYPVDPNVAAAVYGELSRKFDIKKYGTWKAVLDARSENIVAVGEIHEKTIREFNDDIAIVRMIQDIQHRLRDKVKNIWEVLARVIQQNKKYGTTAGMIELDGQLVVRDLERQIPTYSRYIDEVCREQVRFIKPDLVSVIVDMMPAMPEKPFEQLLLSYHERAKKSDKESTELTKTTVEHLFNVVLADRTIATKISDVSELLIRVRGLYTSSRSSNDLLVQMRKLGEKIIKKDLKIVNVANVSALRTGLLLYLVLRTATKNHYN